MSPNDNKNNEQNVFDQAGDFVQNQAEEAQKKFEEAKGQADTKAEEAQKAAKEGWDNLNKSESEKKEAGEKTIGENIGSFIDSAKDTTGKVVQDAKAKLDETFQGDKKN